MTLQQRLARLPGWLLTLVTAGVIGGLFVLNMAWWRIAHHFDVWSYGLIATGVTVILLTVQSTRKVLRERTGAAS